MALDFPLDFFGSGTASFDVKTPNSSFYSTNELFLDTNSEFFSGPAEVEAGTGRTAGTAADSQGFYGGFDGLLDGVDRAGKTIFGLAGRTFDAIDRFQSSFNDRSQDGGGPVPTGGGGGGGLLDGPLMPLAVTGGIVVALWFAFK